MMTLDEFSYEFDVLASSYLHEGGFTTSDSSVLAFNEYEKSVYLTREQESLVLGLYSDGSSIGSFERTEQLRRDLENLLEEKTADPANLSAEHIAPGSQFFKIPDSWNLWFIVYEAGRYAEDENDACTQDIDSFPVEIVPVTYDTLHRIKDNPFRGPTNRRALRVDKGLTKQGLANTNTVKCLEVLSKKPLGKYYVKFIRRPKPIILTDLEDGLSVNGVSEKSECELHSSLHRFILDGAVKMAVSTRVGPGKEENQ